MKSLRKFYVQEEHGKSLYENRLSQSLEERIFF